MRCQALERRMNPLPAFLSDEGMSRRRVGDDKAIDQTAGPSHRARRTRRASPGRRCGFRPQMPAVHLRDLLRRQPVQPRIERQGSVSRIIGQLSRRVEQGCLHDIGGIEPGRYSRIQS